MALLETKNLTFKYGIGTPFEKTAMDNVNIQINEGEFIGVIGHTGSGKSTLVQHFNGLIRPTDGQVLFDGKDIWAEPKKIRNIRFKIGLVFQYPEYQLFEETCYKDICFGPKNMGLSGDDLHKRVMAASEFVGLKPELLEKSPFDLSGGEKRRVAIAGVIAMDPKILILDEPTAGLDPHGRDVILSQIKQYQRSSGTTVILVSHSMEDIARYVERIIVMNRGEKMLDGTPGEVFSHYKELETMGLAAPQITYIMHALKEHGLHVDADATTVEEARDSILAALAQANSPLLNKGGAEK